MPLIREGASVADDFVRVADDEAIPAAGGVIVTAVRLMTEAEVLSRRADPVGVIWPNSRNLQDLASHLQWLSLVALVFPSFRDGRAYSQARILRENLGFKGELRATGQVLRDQFLFMIRAGFSALEVSKESDAAVFPDVLRRYSVFYQPTADGRITAFGARRGGHSRPRTDALGDEVTS